MTIDAREMIERRARELCETGDLHAAATLLLKGYGSELLGFVLARVRQREAANEIFSRFTEDLWRGLHNFRWLCSARVWCYTLARHAASHYEQDVQRRRRHELPKALDSSAPEIAERVRTITRLSARTDTKSRIVSLRERLPLDDQTLLILRINKGLAWHEIAQVMFHEGEVVQPGLLEREAVRLRKRFQAVKEKLRRMAEREGLIGTRDS